MFSIRVLRRRWVLAVIFLGSLIYFVSVTLSKNKTLLRDDYTIKHSLLRQTFQWQPMVPDVAEGNNTTLLQCRNSVQGKAIIVDERGNVCAREHLAVTNCCDIKTPTTSRYNCSTCQQNACCSIYELCVSCCLQPEKKPVLQKILQEARNSDNKLYVSVSDQFELCLVKCRTSSQVEDKIAQVLAQKVEKHFNKEDRKEALIQLLGDDYVNKYLPNAKPNPQILEPPNMPYEEKQRMLKEAQAYLISQVYKAAKEAGYNQILSGAGVSSDENPPPDYSRFLEHTFRIFTKGLDRELYQQEQELAKKKKHQLELEHKYLKTYKVPVPSRIKATATASSSTTTSASVHKPTSGAIRAMVHNVVGDPPPLWGPQSDNIGKSILAVLQRDPRKFDHVAGRLHGRQLPGTLRAFMWAEVLFKQERKRMKDVNAEKVVRERFAKAISRGMQDLRISRATNSPISGLIDTAVYETYNKTTCMVDYQTNEHRREACRTLNVLYVYDRSYEPYLIHWLFPLQITFQNPSQKSSERGEQVIELAMYLDLLNSTCFPKWPQVFAIAEQVLGILKQADPDFHSHLKNISKKNVKVNPKEFLVHLIHQEKAKAEELLKATPGGAREKEMSAELLADPLVFIRRWIGECFVSVLDMPGVMYVWDQCFLQCWKDSVLIHFCLVLLMLLKHKFMQATDYLGMKEVFFNEPCKLYTIDIQTAWIHLETGKDLADIPYLNRQRPVSPLSQGSRMQSLTPPPVAGLSNTCGIKDLKMKLIIPSEAVQKEPWLAQVDSRNLKLHVAAYFGSIKLMSRMSLHSAIATGMTKDSYGNTVYDVVFPADKFVFENMDFTQYDVERELGAYPYAIVKLEYIISGSAGKGRSPVPVGWARIPLFQKVVPSGRESITSVDIQWNLLSGENTYTLHAGEVPESLVATLPVTPSEGGRTEEGNIIGYNSELNALVYDPRNEPQSDTPPPIPSMPPIETQIPPTDTQDPSPVPMSTPRASPLSTKQATPMPPSQRPDLRPWVPHNPEAAQSNPKPTGLKDALDLYIDAVRFIPDNATVIKVTGRLLRTGQLGNIEDILAIPELNGSARSPIFRYRLEVSTQNKEADQGFLAFIRVYTADITIETIGVIGSCLVPLFDNKKLRVGGHQYQLRSGVPDLKQGIANIRPTDLDHAPVVPGASILVRILPHSQDYVPAPLYSTGYYFSENCRPNSSEMRIFESYSDHMQYPKTVREMIQRVQQLDGAPQGRQDKELIDWLLNRLDIKKHLPDSQPAGNLALTRCVRYKLRNGLRVKINQAFGLPDNLYIQCFVRVAPGQKVIGFEPNADGYGKEEKFITLRHDYSSYQQAPIWVDESQLIHPYYDSNSCLVIQLFSLDLKYHPLPDHSAPGKVTDSKGRELSLEDENRILGWVIVPLFEDNCVLMGTHFVPVFKGRPTAEILELLTTNSAQAVLAGQDWTPMSRYPAGHLSVTLFDGHFEWEHVPEKLEYEYLLESVGKLADFRKARKVTTGKLMSAFVLDSLEPKDKKQGTGGAVYKKELAFFQDLMSRTFYDLMENALMTAGYGPL